MRRNLSGIGDLIQNTLKQYHLDKRTKQELALADWTAIVGEKAASVSKPDRIRDGILFVVCKNSAWAQELSFLKEHIIKGLNKRAGKASITDIRFSGSGLPKSYTPEALEEEEVPSAKQIQEMELAESEISCVSRIVEGVTNQDLAEKIRNAIESQRKLEDWKLAHGWRRCSECGELHKESEDTCRRPG